MERFPYADHNKHFRLIRRTERKRASIFIIIYNIPGKVLQICCSRTRLRKLNIVHLVHTALGIEWLLWLLCD